jgi:xylulokinase
MPDAYLSGLLDLAFGTDPVLPAVLGSATIAGQTHSGALLGPGTGHNAAALGCGAVGGDLLVSIGTSGYRGRPFDAH